MRPVAIFRHSPTEGPGYFAIFLEHHRLPWQLIAIDAGEPVPCDPRVFSGLCFMGGPMSVNDPLPWIDEVCALIRAADAAGIPVIGHCLGGQLLAKALGGEVTRNPVKEIGWGDANPVPGPQSSEWLGDLAGETASVFHWHGETFSLPTNATRLLGTQECANQMFVHGRHLGMQCHVEMTPEMIVAWCRDWRQEIAGLAALPASVQTPEQIAAETLARLPRMRRFADRVYGSWLRRLRT